MTNRALQSLLCGALVCVLGVGCQSHRQTLDEVVDHADSGAEGDASGSTLAPGMYDLSIEHGSHTRTFRLQVPESTPPNGSPVLFVFHGGGGNGERMEVLGFTELGLAAGWIVVYPDGIESNWADGRGTTDAAIAGADDVGFVAALIDEIGAYRPVDESRIFATGASNGAIFSHRLACDLSDRFRAVAPVIGSLATEYRPRCEPSRPIDVLSIRGTDDPFIPIDGGDSAHERFPNLGDGGLVESAEAARLFWADANGCAEATEEELEPVHPDDPTRVRRVAHERCDDGVHVIYYIVDGMGHTWPPESGIVPRVSGESSTQLDATELIWDFFSSRD